MWMLLSLLQAQAGEVAHAAAKTVHFTVGLRCGALVLHAGKSDSVLARGDFGDRTPTRARSSSCPR
jgi:hypothetical protein